MPDATTIVEAQHHAPGVSRTRAEHLVVESPLAIHVNGQPYTITMRTPGHDLQLARGLLYAEGLGMGEPWHAVAEPHCLGGTVSVTLPQGTAFPPRASLSTSSCGVCGRQEIDTLLGTVPASFPGVSLSPATLHGLHDRMRAAQAAFTTTGGSHAAAAARADGTLLLVMEDVGRHNAVDKVVGELLYRGEIREAAVLLVSGRLSWEILQKAARAGIPVISAVSAPTSLAVQWAREWGMTVLGFCRDGRMNVYTGPERILGADHGG